ncbi:MAG: type IV pilus assembly protein PilM [Bradymonadia bacterium]|jgi:type IV pilus assembly protein PilM
MARGRNALGLDIGTSSIKLVQLKESKKGIQLASFSMAPLPSEAIVDGAVMNSGAVVDTIQAMVAAQKLKNRQCAISISGHSVIIKKISLPAMTPEELDESIKWEAEQYIPFDVNDVYIDYQILQTRPEQGQMDVLLVAAKKEMVDEYANVVREAGLEPVVVGIDCLTIQQCFELNYGYPPGETIVLINTGASTININVVANGITTFTRDIAMGGNQFTEEIQKQLNVSYDEAEAYKLGGERGVDADSVVPQEVERVVSAVSEQMASEIHRSLDFYMATSSEGRISRIYLSGGSAKIPALGRTLENRIGVACELVDPFRGVQVDPKLFNLDYINQVRPLAAVVVGLGLRKTGDFRINLLPVKEARKRESGKQFLVFFAVLLIAELGVLYYWQSETEAELARVEGQNAKIQAQLKDAEEKSAQVAKMQAEKDELEKQKVVLDGLLEGQAGPVKMLDEVSVMLTPVSDPIQKLAQEKRRWNPDWDPKRLWVESFVEASRKLKIQGYARTNDDLAEFLHRLNTSKHFVEVRLNLSEMVEVSVVPGLKLVRFDVDALALYGPADVKRLAAGEIGVAAERKKKQGKK